MLRSMTGYARVEKAVRGVNAFVELKTVNSKYLNVDINIGDAFSELEMRASRFIKENLKRGTVRAKIDISLADSDDLLQPDYGIASSIFNSLKTIKDRFELAGEVSVDSMARFKEIFRSRPSEDLADKIWSVIEELLIEALDQLNADREREGQNLALAMSEYLNRLEVIANELLTSSEDMVLYYRDFLKKRIETIIEGQFDENRLEQEVALLAERADISEEIVRLHSHLKSFRGVMRTDKESGVQMDFICQEMHRELSTIASKSKKLAITNLSIEGRTLVNKLREQVQNIE
ncbi:MAG TPA: YicC family protein [Mesotoga sp.]|uniref:YicC/YloC family endoribonuclease n=1 Tax=unclassified Mesotoga TaxID=1184398 RepID=UPI000A965967|nr:MULTISPECIES: YicC/YloC family endoribonuclease [unclassified Mesotoga]MDD3459728.1 YicC family protein [Mesotoga sp.]HNU23561.1 YicC family protein [Mesotoga sp.]